MSSMMTFPTWFAKNSVKKKQMRFATELACNINAGTRSEVQKVTLTSTNITLDYLEILKIKMIQPLYSNGNDGIEEVIDFMKQYNVTKENWYSLCEMGLFGRTMSKLNPQTKSKLTRECKKELNVIDMASGRNLTKTQISDMIVSKGKREETPDSGSDDDGDITKDKRIKMKKPKAKKGKKKTAKGKGKKATAKKTRGKR